MYAISDNGTILWYYDAKSPIGNATSYINGNILFSTKSGELFKVYDGQIYITTPPTNSVRSMSAQSVNAPTLALYETKLPQWGTYQGNNRRSGVQAESYISTDINNVGLDANVRFKSVPNPFTDYTEILYSIEQSSRVRIVVMYISGRAIERYDLGTQTTGEYKKRIDGSRFDAGMYLCKFRFG